MIKIFGSHNMTMLNQTHVIMRCVIKRMHCINNFIFITKVTWKKLTEDRSRLSYEEAHDSLLPRKEHLQIG